MSDDIIELDDHREPRRRRSDRFVAGALLSGALVFGTVIAIARPVAPGGRASAATPPATVAPSILLPTPLATPRLRIQPPIFRPGTPFPRPSLIPLPPPDVWRSGQLP